MSTNAVHKTCDMIEKELGRSTAFRKVEDNLYVVKQGSAYVTVCVMPSSGKAEQPLIRIYAQVVAGVNPEPGLFRQLLVINGRMRFGAFAYVPEGSVVLFTHTILAGAHLDPAELKATVHDIAVIADSYDDRIVAAFGGQRMQDILEEAALGHLLGARQDQDGHIIWDEAN